MDIWATVKCWSCSKKWR